MLRICVLIPKVFEHPDGTVVVDEAEVLCMTFGPINPFDIVTQPEQWSLTLGGKELTISTDLQDLSLMSSVASRIQDKRIRDVVHDALLVASEIATEALPKYLSVRLVDLENSS